MRAAIQARRARGNRVAAWTLAIMVAAAGSAGAQDLGTLDPKPLPPLANPNDPNNPAKELFGRKTEPAPLSRRAPRPRRLARRAAPPRSDFMPRAASPAAGAADQRAHLAGHAALA